MGVALHEVKVEGLPICGVEEWKLVEELNEHAYLEFCAVIQSEDGKEPLLFRSEEQDPIRLYYLEDGKRKELFCGVVTNADLAYQAGIYELKVVAKSNSYLTDITKKSRTFQQVSMTYQELFQIVLKDYPGVKVLYEIADCPIGELVVQYEETDWDFLKRMASRIGVPVCTEVKQEGICLYIGFPRLGLHQVSMSLIGAEKRFDQYLAMKEQNPDTFDVDYLVYQMKTLDVVHLLERVSYEGREWRIRKVSTTSYHAQLKTSFEMQSERGLKPLWIYPYGLIGASLEGKVQTSKGARVLVSLNIDQPYGGGAEYWFPYSSMSSSPDGSGWYYMPETGDVVRVYFPSKEAGDAVVVSSVSNYKGTDGPDRMQDTSTKYISNSGGQEVTLSSDKVELRSSSGAVVSILSDGTMQLSAVGGIMVEAKDKLIVEAEEELILHGGTSMMLCCDKGGAAVFSEEGIVRLSGTEVKID